MSRYVVTGGAGRLGRSVVATLAAAGHEVASLDVGRVEGLPAEQISVDLCDGPATRSALATVSPDGVVHLAAIAVPFSRPEAEIFDVNTTIMRNVIDAARQAGAPSLLAASSPTVIGYGNPAGWTPDYLPIDERHPVRPWHAYAESKVAIERLIAETAGERPTAMRVGAFRPCYVIAPEEWRGAPTQQGHTVRQRLDDPALSATALFNYVDARDAAEFVLAWLANADRVTNGACFFVGAADALATAPLSELLPRYVDGIGDLAAGLTGRQPAFDCTLAARLLGWTPKRSWRTELVDR